MSCLGPSAHLPEKDCRTRGTQRPLQPLQRGPAAQDSGRSKRQRATSDRNLPNWVSFSVKCSVPFIYKLQLGRLDYNCLLTRSFSEQSGRFCHWWRTFLSLLFNKHLTSPTCCSNPGLGDKSGYWFKRWKFFTLSLFTSAFEKSLHCSLPEEVVICCKVSTENFQWHQSE